MKQPTALIADDEAPLRAFLRRRLAECWPALQIVGEAENGQEALEMIEALQPDVAFLDIRMPLLSGLEVASRLTLPQHVVFVTAYDEYAIQAFDNAAVDYLLKPVNMERLSKTAERLQALLATGADSAPDLSRLLALLPQELRGKPNYLQRIQAGTDGGIVMVPVDSVDFSGRRQIHPGGNAGQRVADPPHAQGTQAALDPERFWRVHHAAPSSVSPPSSAARRTRAAISSCTCTGGNSRSAWGATTCIVSRRIEGDGILV